MPVNRPAKQRQVAHDVEHLVPHEFFGISQRLGREHRVVADDHGILQTAALDQAVFDEVFDFLEKTKCPGVRQFLFPRFGCDFRAVKLREPSALVRAGAGDFESLVGKQRHRRLAHLQLNRRGGRVRLAIFRLRHDAGGLDNFAKLARAAVGNGRLVRVQFDNRIVNAVTRQRREHVLDGVNFHIALGQRRGAVGLADIFHARLDFRFAFEVNAAKPHAAVRGRGENGHVHPVAAVQAGAGKTRGPIQSLLIEHRQIRQNARAIGKLLRLASKPQRFRRPKGSRDAPSRRRGSDALVATAQR